MSGRFFQGQKHGSFRLDILLAGFLVCALTFLVAGNFTGSTGRAARLETGARLIKAQDSATVYFISPAGRKLAFPSAKIFLSYGYAWSGVETVTASQIAFYGDAKFISLGKNSTVYFLDGFTKKPVTSTVLKSLNLQPSEIVTVNRTQLKAYPQGAALPLGEAIEKFAGQIGSEKVLEAQDSNCVPDPEVGGASGCTIFYALQSGDSNLCEDIPTQSWKANCYSAFIASGAMNWEYCLRLTESEARNSCVRFSAVAKRDSLLCGNITDTKAKNKCAADVGVANKDINGCSSLAIAGQKDDADACHFNYALLNKESSACAKISLASPYRTNCANLVVARYSVAQEKSGMRYGNWRMSGPINKIFSLKTAHAQFGSSDILVGGRFLPGFMDIFTPSMACGLLVSVAGPNPGVFTFLPTHIYDEFPYVLNHVGTNTLGLARQAGVCPPALYMFGSSRN